MLPNGAAVIDTPGMRELGMWDASIGLSTAFSDIEELAAQCRFGDCTHKNEPGCAVRSALQRGELSEERFLSYEKLALENAYAAGPTGSRAAKERKFKSIAKFNKTDPKR